jgi:AsmA protein
VAEPVRIAKWTAIIVGSVLLLLVATAFVLTSVIDPNRYRSKIESVVTAQAGRPFVIEGNIEITWFPWLGLRTGAAHLNNRDGSSSTLPIVEWQSITVAARLLPLLRGQVVVDRVRLQSPRVRLTRDAQGHGNWEDLGPRSSPTSVTLPASTSAEAGQETPPQIAGIEIRGGALDYVDATTGLQVHVSGLELDLGEWRPGRPFPVHTRLLVQTPSLPPSGVWVQVDARELAVVPTPLTVKAPKLSVRVSEAQIDGDLVYEQTGDAHVRARGSVALRAPSVRKLANDLGLNQVMPHDPTTLGALELTSVVTYTDGSIASRPLAIKLDGVNFTGWLERTAAPQAAWSFELHGDRIDLGRYVNVDSTNKKPFALPVDALRAVHANGSLIFDQAVLADTHMSDVRLQLQTSAETR